MESGDSSREGKMRNFRCFVGWLLFLLVTGCITDGEPEDFQIYEVVAKQRAQNTFGLVPGQPADKITWRILNNFRVIESEAEQERFYIDLAIYLHDTWKWSDNEKNPLIVLNFLFDDLISTDDNKLEINYNTLYDNKTYSYKPEQIFDVRRTIVLNLSNASDDEMCLWSINRSKEILKRCKPQIEYGTNKCEIQDPCFQGLIDQSYDISVTVQGSSLDAVKQRISIEDTLIVAIGDSHSAGEGNPHRRRDFWRGEKASWWDARCHRSLLSGPALSAAFIARQNPGQSVTFLHYGCSGASINNGIVRPWRGLEASDQWMKRYSRSSKRGPFDNTIPADQHSPCISYKSGQRQFLDANCSNTTDETSNLPDILPSQIDMAKRDLTFKGVFREPDILMVSAGGNDIGFGDFVLAIAATAFRTPEGIRVTSEQDQRKFIGIDESDWQKYSGSALPAKCAAYVEEGKVNSVMKAACVRIHAMLEPNYDILAKRIENDLKPKHVLVTGYASPLKYKSGSGELKYCRDVPGDGRPDMVFFSRKCITGNWCGS